ncbi:TIGR03364 family FAD-dependent oxidoreductase [Owenweeksia hongkongensis]|uniref:TIGR03364 family FAD-dependent oxidoreductase n=1 Tax=Owenweeksia hongkongensis TaxID=253245 RepID=UPI003A8E8851
MCNRTDYCNMYSINNMDMKSDVLVIGAGIVGLAHALAFAQRGKNVTVVDRDSRAVGASVRNFGMVWPIGQPAGKLLNRALISRQIWADIANETQIFNDSVGSICLAYEEDELALLQEFYELHQNSGYKLEWVSPDNLKEYSKAAKSEGFLGGLFSATELIVDPREALAKIPQYLNDKYGVEFLWNRPIQKVESGKAWSADFCFEAEHILVCTGADFEVLYPEVYSKNSITKCKLQMMRTLPQSNDWRLGPAISGGLTLLHYQAFQECKSLLPLKERVQKQMPDYVKYGIHVMASQNGLGEIIIGDSHEYAQTHDPFNREHINEKILSYFHKMVEPVEARISEHWQGIYAKMTDGATEFVYHPEAGVTIVNGLGGAGMTLSFGLAEETVSEVLEQKEPIII